MSIVIETSKGAVSLAGATSVTVKRSPLAYVPKLIGLVVAILGGIALFFVIGGMISEWAHTPWYGWLFMVLWGILALYAGVVGGLMLLNDPGAETENGFRHAEDSYSTIIFILILMGGLSLLLTFLSAPTPGSEIGGGIFCFFLAGITYWSKGLAGKVDATIAYATHRTTIRALSPFEAGKLTTAFRERQPLTCGVD